MKQIRGMEGKEVEGLEKGLIKCENSKRELGDRQRQRQRDKQTEERELPIAKRKY